MKRNRRFNLTPKDFEIIRQTASMKDYIRKYEIDKIMENVRDNNFENVLELGCGNGKYSKYLASYCKKLTAIEYNERRLTAISNEKMICNVQ